MKRSSTILGILAAALLLAATSFAGLKPSNNATRQEVESDTTLAVKGVLDIESGGSLKFNGTAFSASDYVPVTKAGQQTITATGAGNDITLTSADDIKFVAKDYFRAELTDANHGFTVSAAGFSVGTPNGVHELGGSNASGIYVLGQLRLIPQASPTLACAGGTEGALYLDADTHLLCVCNGTGYVQVADGSTACS